MRQVRVEVEGGDVVEQPWAVEVADGVEWRDFLGSFDDGGSQPPNVVNRHVERPHQRAGVLAEALLARDQAVAVVFVLDLPLAVVVGEADIVMGRQKQAGALSFQPLGDRSDLFRGGFLFGKQMVKTEHHGDRLVPRQQRFSQYTRSLMRALDVPVHNIWGLRPAVVEGTKEIAPLNAIRDLDSPRLLDNVTTFNFHPHLPHYELTAPQSDGLRVLGRQRVDPNRPHPFTEAGNTKFNALIWMPPAGQRAGDIVLIDSTHFTTLFGGTDSLKNLWHNLVTMK